MLYMIVVAPAVGGALDRAVFLVCATLLVQLVPLPAAVGSAFSPEAARVRETLFLGPRVEAPWHPLTIDVPASAWAALEVIGAAALFFAARERFARGGVRRTARAIAGIGLLMSLLALAQNATAGRAIYWLFETEVEGPLPLGPFVNRNHFATWAIMAIPLCLGYIAAHAGAHQRDGPDRRSLRARAVNVTEGRVAWLTAAVAAMLIAVLVSLSRSAAIGLGSAGLVTLWLLRDALEPSRLRRLIAGALILCALALAWGDVRAVRRKLAGTPDGLQHRAQIWKETVPIVRDFLAAGTGAGTYELAMRVYQQSDRRVYFNQAHNHYLQLISEGGVLVAIPVLLTLLAFVRAARKRLQADRTGIWWLRAGAACGLAAVAMQSLWETGLTMSANAALAAVLAAVVVHDRE